VGIRGCWSSPCRGAELVSKLLGSVQAIDRLTLVRSFDDFSRRYQDAALLAVDPYGFIMQTHAAEFRGGGGQWQRGAREPHLGSLSAPRR